MHRCSGAEVYYWLCTDIIVPLCSCDVYHFPFSLHTQMLWCRGLITGRAQMFCAVSVHLVLSSWMVNNFIPDVWQVVFAKVSVKCGVVDSYVYGLLDALAIF